MPSPRERFACSVGESLSGCGDEEAAEGGEVGEHAERYLESAGIRADWPYGRGCWVSADGCKSILYGDEDHLRVMVVGVGSLINEPFEELKRLLDALEQLDTHVSEQVGRAKRTVVIVGDMPSIKDLAEQIAQVIPRDRRAALEVIEGDLN